MLNQAAMLLIIIAAAFGYWQWSQAKIEKLENAAVTYEAVIAESAETIQNLKVQALRNEMANNILGDKLRSAESYGDDLMRKLQRHDLTRLAAAKPGLVDKRMKDATKEIFEELESITDR